MSMFTAALDAKNARKAAKKKDTTTERTAQSSSRSIEQPPIKESQPQQQQQQQQQILNTSSTSGVDAIEEITGMSVEERDSISNFIKQVLEQPEMDLTARMRDESNTLSTVGAMKRNTGSGAGAEDDALTMTLRSTRGKIAIYCQEENSTANKVLYISPNTKFEEFCAMVEKKFGRKMAMSFNEGE
ncbi:hypothetical protein MOQ_009154, partial [Trypanosoma cruzi marinkellei]